jgi:putative DNA primase/helicase
MLNKALGFADKGMRVFPLFEPSAIGSCSCSDGEGCGSIGKHPRIGGGLKSATTDPGEIRRWWERWPKANIGIATGGGTFVLDVDYGHDGDESLSALEEEYEELSDDHPRINTGNGVHYYFRSEVEVRNSASKIGPGLDIRGEGGYVVSSGSMHGNGNVYTHDYGSGTDLLDAPEWLMDLVAPKGSMGAVLRLVKQSDPADRVTQGSRNDYLTKIAGKLRRDGYEEDAIYVCLYEKNGKFPDPLEDAEVKKISKSVMRYNPIHHEDAWMEDLRVDQRKNPKRVAGNAVLYMSKHSDWEGVLGFNEMRQRVVWLKDAPGELGMAKPKAGEQLADWHCAHVGHWFDKNVGLTFTHDTLVRCIAAASQINPFHPVRQYLESLEWDGEPRVEKWLTSYMGASDNPYNNVIGRCWIISAVARIMKPGCQADHVLVLESPQGRGKSTGMAALFGHGDGWYMESLPELTQGGGKDAMASLAGPWCIEIAELDAIRGKASTKIKDFISRRVDEYRPSYGRCHIRLPRQCVFVGTTNSTEWHSDPTGARRFWPCKAGNIDRVAILRDRDQLWAEAVQHYTDGADWWPTEEFNRTLIAEQEARFTRDVWEDTIAKYMEDKVQVEVEHLFTMGLSIEQGRISRADQTRVGNIMSRLGYYKHRYYHKRVRYTVYRKTDVAPEEFSQSSPDGDE